MLKTLKKQPRSLSLPQASGHQSAHDGLFDYENSRSCSNIRMLETHFYGQLLKKPSQMFLPLSGDWKRFMLEAAALGNDVDKGKTKTLRIFKTIL